MTKATVVDAEKAVASSKADERNIKEMIVTQSSFRAVNTAVEQKKKTGAHGDLIILSIFVFP